MNRKVKSLMVLKGITGVDIARKLNLSPVTVYIVVSGRGKSRRIQQTIANALGMSFTELWPRDNDKAA